MVILVPLNAGLCSGEFFAIVLNTVGIFGPTVAAMVVTAWCSQLAGVRSLLAQGLRWRYGWQWYGVVFGLPPLISSLALLFHIMLGATGTFFLRVDNWLLEPLSFILILLATVPLAGGEEFGWRGFLLPTLQSRLNSLWSSLCVGIIWAF
ncbi:CPBP family intramembrane metalloprotease [bacterium]|nr:CPBP family intramembrane metalloprotease [bacterium]